MTGVPRRNTEQPALAAERLRAQLLSGVPAGTVAGVTGHLLAVQAQDSRGMRLAVRARTSGLLATHVDEALTADRSVVVSWLNRGTLHLVLAEDYWWLHQLTTPQLAAGNKRRLAQEGVSPQDAERGVRVIERAHGVERKGLSVLWMRVHANTFLNASRPLRMRVLRLLTIIRFSFRPRQPGRCRSKTA